MSTLTLIKDKIMQLDGGHFQELCDAYLTRLGYKNMHSLGTKAGTHKSTKGVPDAYFMTEDNKYVLAAYTTQQTVSFSKLKNDIADCLNPQKTGIVLEDIVEIICCHTADNLTPGQDKELRNLCLSHGIPLLLKGVDEIASDLYHRFPRLALDFLGIKLTTEQIFSKDEFIQVYDANPMAAPLSYPFLFRENELNALLQMMENSDVSIVTGPAGVGKTRLALECCQRYAETHGALLLCIRSNRLCIYEDLRFYLEMPGKYLLFVDDANELTNLTHVLNYLLKRKEGYEVKIVLTVRDYAKDHVISDVRKYCLDPYICTVAPFSDEQIKALLEQNLEIFNHIFTRQITRISEGNARLAVLAGKLALDKRTLESIRDVSGIYESYYGDFLNGRILNQNNNLIGCAGIIAFMNVINLSEMGSLDFCLEELGIDRKRFEDCVRYLHDQEIVDIYHNQVVKISDQCVGNYLVKHVFVDEQIIPLSTMVGNLFVTRKTAVVETVSMLTHVFASPDVIEKVRREICLVWDELQQADKTLFREFVKMFYAFRPVETLILLNDEIDSLPGEEFDIDEVDFAQKRNHISVNDEIVNILIGFKYKRELPEALDLLFEYYAKYPSKFMEIYHAITRYLSIDKDSHTNDYWTQIQLVSKFQQDIENGLNHNMSLLFIRAASELLKLEFSPVEAGRHNTVIFYDIPLVVTEGSKTYRSMIWETLQTLYNHERYRSYIEALLVEYSNQITNNLHTECGQFDIEYISKFFDKAFSPENLSHCIIAEGICEWAQRNEINQPISLKRYLESRDFLVYQALKHGFRENEETRKQKITRLLTQDKVTIAEIMRVCAEYEKLLPKSTYNLRYGLQLVFDFLCNDHKMYVSAVEEYLANDTPLRIPPSQIVPRLFEFVGVSRTESIINSKNYGQKNLWRFSFFEHLPEEYVSEEYVGKFYEFIVENEGDIRSSPYRDLSFLQKYEPYDSEIIIRTSRIILQKYEYSPFMFDVYSRYIVDPYLTPPAIILERYKTDLDLLAEIYFRAISRDNSRDSDGSFLMAFIEYHPPIFEKYLQYITTNNLFAAEGRLAGIWERNNYLELADKFVDTLLNLNLKLWDIGIRLSRLLGTDDASETWTASRDTWISHFIETYHNNMKLIQMLFDALGEIPVESLRKHVLLITRLNKDPKLFSSINIEPQSGGALGISLVPELERRIEFLESLLPHFTGIDYLQHKLKIEQRIRTLKQRIEQELVNETIYNLSL